MIATILAAPLLLAQPRLTFIRVVPARYDLSWANEIVIVYGIGDNDSVETFVGELTDHTNRSGPLHLTDATSHGAHFLGQKVDERTVARLKRQYPADGYMGVKDFTCDFVTRTGEGSTTDYEGSRVRRKHEFVDAKCRAHIEISSNGRPPLAFDIMGEGTSPRVDKITEEDKLIARESAARYAAIAAADAITPREVRESIVLDETAPLFDRGMVQIDAGNLREARRIWESALPKHAKSGPLLYDLAAVCEAAGDMAGARSYLDQAIVAAPKEKRYRDALADFRRRNGR